MSSPENRTIYVGGLVGIGEEKIRSAFAPFGKIIDVSVNENGAMISFETKEMACTAITSVHGTVIEQCRVKVSWGDSSALASKTTIRSLTV